MHRRLEQSDRGARRWGHALHAFRTPALRRCSSPRKTSTKLNDMKTVILLTATLVPLLLVGSSHAADVQANWTKHCASCHGKDGKGQTKAGKMAGVKDQTDPQYQAGLKEDKMFASVKEGVKEDGKEKMK